MFRHVIMPQLLLGLTGASATAQEMTFSSRTLTTEAALAATRRRCNRAATGIRWPWPLPTVWKPHQYLARSLCRRTYRRNGARKAYTAASFRMDTTSLALETAAGEAASGIRQVPQVLALGGGLPIESAGALVGAIGVSGAPGQADDGCARPALTPSGLDFE